MRVNSMHRIEDQGKPGRKFNALAMDEVGAGGWSLFALCIRNPLNMSTGENKANVLSVCAEPANHPRPAASATLPLWKTTVSEGQCHDSASSNSVLCAVGTYISHQIPGILGQFVRMDELGGQLILL